MDFTTSASIAFQEKVATLPLKHVYIPDLICSLILQSKINSKLPIIRNV